MRDVHEELQEDPREPRAGGPREAPRSPKWAPEGPQDWSRRASRGPRTGPEKDPRGPQEQPKRAPGEPRIGPKSKIHGRLSCILLWGPLGAVAGLLRPQDGSKMAQATPKTSPRGPPKEPRSTQERSKSAPKRASKSNYSASDGGRNWLLPLL